MRLYLYIAVCAGTICDEATRGDYLWSNDFSIIQSNTLFCASEFVKWKTGPPNINIKYIAIDTCRLPNQNQKKKY